MFEPTHPRDILIFGSTRHSHVWTNMPTRHSHVWTNMYTRYSHNGMHVSARHSHVWTNMYTRHSHIGMHVSVRHSHVWTNTSTRLSYSFSCTFSVNVELMRINYLKSHFKGQINCLTLTVPLIQVP